MLSRLRQLVDHDLWLVDLDTLPRGPRLGVRGLRLALAVGSEFRHQLLDARAAGLVYTTLLSLAPFLAVTFSVLKAFGVHQKIEPVLAEALEPLGPMAQDVTAQVIDFVSHLKVGVLGIAGVAGLLYTTFALIGKVEEALNAIWRVRQGRSWSRKFTDYLSVVLVGPVLLTTALGLLASVQSHAVVQHVLALEPFGSLMVWAARAVPFLLLCGVFTFVYQFVPNTAVDVRSAVVGGVTAALLWGGCGQAFASFVAGSGKYSAIYSGFAILIVFLLWLYLGWLIVLVGAQVAFFHQHPVAYEAHPVWQRGAHAVRERMVLRVLVSLVRRYVEGGGPYPATDLADEAGAPLDVVEAEIDGLAGRGILCRVATPEGVGLARPPEGVTVAEVLDALRGRDDSGVLAPGPAAKVVEEALLRRDEAAAAALGGVTLRALALSTGVTAASPAGEGGPPESQAPRGGTG